MANQRAEIVMYDGLVRHVEIGKCFEHGGKNYKVNRAGKLVLLYDPDYKPVKLTREEMSPSDRALFNVCSVIGVITVLAIIAAIVAMVIA
jgi:hypothetical protein